jgi:chromate transport protein ChrA
VIQVWPIACLYPPVELKVPAADKVLFVAMNMKDPKRSMVATLLSIEAGIVLALGLWLIFFSFTHENEELAPLLGEISFAAIGAVGLFVAGRGYRNGKNYGRSPAILSNLIALGVAYYQIQGAFYIGAVIILALALPILFLAFTIAKNEG